MGGVEVDAMTQKCHGRLSTLREYRSEKRRIEDVNDNQRNAFGLSICGDENDGGGVDAE